jgi:penicillin amidase
MKPSHAGALALAVLTAAACGDSGGRSVDAPSIPSGPFDSLPLTEDVPAGGLDGPVHAARDQYGIMHIQAATPADLAYAEGYLMAHDRLPQMDILRRFGSGTLAELFGALDQSTVETDLQMRVHRMRPLAMMDWAMLQSSTDPADQQMVKMLQRFADGVNAYNADLVAGKFTLDQEVSQSFDPNRFKAWDPIDSLVLVRFESFALSWTTPLEIDLTTVYQGARTTFDNASPTNAAAYARRGISHDLLYVTPVGTYSTIDGFPNVGTDSGTRSNSGRPNKRRVPPAPTATSFHVPRELLDNARAFLADPLDPKKGHRVLSPHRFMVPYAGSNNWVVGPTLGGGKTMIAGDQHLQLPNPMIWWPVHLMLTDGSIDAEGVTFPGIPGIILGHNGKVAWQATVVYHDVNDVFMENIVPCSSGGGDCVLHDGGQVPIQTWNETISVGALGTITGTVNATYELVPHHGPIIPTVANGMIVPRTGSTALSVQYTGYQPTLQLRTVWYLMHSSTIDDVFKSIGHFDYGGQNWAVIDNQGNYGWTSHAEVPLRKAAAYAWNASTNPDGAAPFMVLPGDGSADWTGAYMDPRYVPHAIDPAAGYLATANSDPVGSTFDDDPLNQPIVNGIPLYAGTLYAAGVRAERISDDIKAAATRTGNNITLDDMAAIQHDSTSTMGAKLAPAVLTAMGALDSTTGLPSDVAPYLAGLSSGDKASLASARALLQKWTFATPTGLATSATQQELDDSAATALFNAWMHYFIADTLTDEYAAINFNVWNLEQNLTARIVYAMLVTPDKLMLSPTTGQPILCDDMATVGADESCTRRVLQAAIEAWSWAASPQGFGTTDTTMWHWGDKHRLTLPPLFPNAQLNVPPPDDPVNPKGFAKPGDQFVVNRSDMGWDDLDFHQFADGPSERFLASADSVGATIHARWQLPGGTIYDRSSKHYRDLLDKYYLPQVHFDVPYSIQEIVTAGEERWVFH